MSQVIEIDGRSISGPKRDTVIVQGGCQSTVIAFDANNPGVWAFHCHMVTSDSRNLAEYIDTQSKMSIHSFTIFEKQSLHRAAGMYTTVEYID